MSEKQLLCDFCAKMIFFAGIDCLGVKQLENHEDQLFRALDQIFELLMKTTPILSVFDTVNILKLFYLIELSVCLVLYNSDIVLRFPYVNKRVRGILTRISH